jgi:hypothetical protein
MGIKAKRRILRRFEKYKVTLVTRWTFKKFFHYKENGHMIENDKSIVISE